MLLATVVALTLQVQQAAVPLPALAPAVATPRTAQAIRRQGGVTLDGRLTEAAWDVAPRLPPLVQRDPSEGAPASEPSEIRILFDDDALYVGARLFDQAPDSIIARLARRDHTSTSDAFTVFLDPYHDGRTGFYFGVNAAGTLYDGTLMNDDWDDDTWDGIWEAKVARDSSGWSVEFRIPYSQLRFRQQDQYQWGINVKRQIARRNETDYLAMVPKRESGFVSRFLTLEGMRQVTPPRRLEFLPYVTTKAEFLDQPKGNPFNDGSRFRGSAGADFKLGLGSNLTLDATVNPDFGQVEVDPAVVNLSDVETFYPEKRPFFIEGSNIFAFGSGGANNNWGFNFSRPDLFYTRRIGRAPSGTVPDATYSDVPDGTTILGAAKLSGKVAGNLNLGLLTALTDREQARLSGPAGQSRVTVEPRASYTVLRGQRESRGGRSSIGFIATGTFRDLGEPGLRDQFNQDALTGGVDGWTFLDRGRMWALTGQFAATRVDGSRARILDLQQSAQHYYQRPDAHYVSVDSGATSLGGWMSRVALNKQRGNWQLNSAIGAIHPGFDANDLGFQWRTDVINGHIVGGYRWTDPGRVFRRFNLYTSYFQSRDFDGNRTWEGLWGDAWGQLLNYYNVEVWGAYNPMTINTRRTRGGPRMQSPGGFELGSYVGTDDRKAVIFSVNVNTNQYGQESQKYWSISPTIEWKPASALSLSFSPGLEFSRTGAQYVTTVDDTLAGATFGHRYVFADLRQTTLSGSVRLNWTFSPRLSFELYAQPLIASGNYRGYKELARPNSYAFTPYGSGGSTISPVIDAKGVVTDYAVDPDGGGSAPSFTVPNRDFNLASLRGNAVLRWEYLPGSTLYLVWTQDRSDSSPDGDFHFGRSLQRLFQARGNHIVAIKLSYWWHP
jgi:hypothetical protein